MVADQLEERRFPVPIEPIRLVYRDELEAISASQADLQLAAKPDATAIALSRMSSAFIALCAAPGFLKDIEDVECRYGSAYHPGDGYRLKEVLGSDRLNVMVKRFAEADWPHRDGELSLSEALELLANHPTSLALQGGSRVAVRSGEGLQRAFLDVAAKVGYVAHLSVRAQLLGSSAEELRKSGIRTFGVKVRNTVLVTGVALGLLNDGKGAVEMFGPDPTSVCVDQAREAVQTGREVGIKLDKLIVSLNDREKRDRDEQGRPRTGFESNSEDPLPLSNTGVAPPRERSTSSRVGGSAQRRVSRSKNRQDRDDLGR